MFQRIGAAAYKADLGNTIAICRLLGNPEKKFRSIHVAGTNGKGSTSHMLASVLQEAGFKTGLYTSPHLKDFRERIRINGQMIPEYNVVEFVEKYKKDFEEIKPSFFEMTVGLAFEYFAVEKVDIAIIEVGLGGRLDSTNVISPLASVITNISYDHTALLGDTLEKIAAEKAGVIKPGTPVVISERQKDTQDVFVQKAKEMNAEIVFAEDEYVMTNVKQIENRGLFLKGDVLKSGQLKYKKLECGLAGFYQEKNILAVLCTLDQLDPGEFKLTGTSVRNGIRNVVKNTGLLGRWQVLQKAPLAIADTGHNEAGIAEVLKLIAATHYKKLHFVLGMVNDKDISKILGMLPQDATYYFCKANIPRALQASELKAQAKVYGLTGEIYDSVSSAFRAAKQAAAHDDLVLVGGSTFTVAEVV
jgi:dihydrofolate synthase/folylpolyglutamate synthase